MKIYPSDIDTVVERYKAATDVCAFALDDAIYGQSVGMAVVLNDTQDETIQGLHAWMKTQLADHKMPSRWWAIDAIPRTSRGKINREAVKNACEKQSAARPALHPRQETRRMNETREQHRQALLQFLRSVQKAGMPVETSERHRPPRGVGVD
jgi:acyl-CoA synthetase (AMP-forming)/AMP-acid ligase II